MSSLNIDDEDSDLIDALKALSKKNPKLVRSTEYTAPADPSIRLRSWKMNEFKYYDIPSPFPTLARGLFTQEISRPRPDRQRTASSREGTTSSSTSERSLGQQ